MIRLLLGLEPVRTQVKRIAVALGCVAVTSGCDFRHYEAARDSATSRGGSPNAGTAGMIGTGGAAAGTPNAGAAGMIGTGGAAAGTPNAGTAGMISVGGAAAGATSVRPPITPCPGESAALCESACLSSSDLANVPKPFAQWTFDGNASSPEQDHWADAVSSRQLLWSDNAAPTVKDYPRINGKGNSIYLDGKASAYLEQDLLSDARNGFTLSVWISLERKTWLEGVYSSDAPFTWPILYTRTASSTTSGGNAYLLALRRASQGGDFELVFSYQDGSPLGIHEVRFSLKDAPSWQWQAGTWHHVAVAHWKDEQFNYSKLTWDGDKTLDQAPRVAIANSDASASNPPPVLRIGSGADPSKPGFKGYLDELALFTQPLLGPDLDHFTLSSTSRVGPSGCRWRAAENWNDSVNKAISKTDWIDSESSASSAAVNIDDQDWGAGSLQAILPAPLALRNYRNVHLQASVEANSAFQLTLAKGATYCSWVAKGKGPTDTHYQFDLTNPMNCASRTCEIGLTNIESISIASEWSTPCASQSKYICNDGRVAEDQTLWRPPGNHKFTISDIAFEPIGLELLDWSAYEPALGPNNWCWRPQAYEPGALGTLSAAAKPELVTAQLTGQALTATRLVADFGDAGRDLSKCTSVVFSGEKASKIPSLVIEDVFGSWGSGLLGIETAGSFGCSNFRSLPYSSTKATSRTNNFDNFPDTIDYTKIRYLGVQKDWGSLTDKETMVKITGVQLFGEGNGPCQ